MKLSICFLFLIYFLKRHYFSFSIRDYIFSYQMNLSNNELKILNFIITIITNIQTN